MLGLFGELEGSHFDYSVPGGLQDSGGQADLCCEGWKYSGKNGDCLSIVVKPNSFQASARPLTS